MVYKDRKGFKWKSKSSYYNYLASDQRKPAKLRAKYKRLAKK